MEKQGNQHYFSFTYPYKTKRFFFWLLLTRVSRAIQASNYSPRNVKTSPHVLYTPGNYPEESLGVGPKMLSKKTKNT